ncbi:glycosyltransferase [Rothia sp. ZJ932]|uniref:glycosyltransferase n=1 Tax=Rothia sp. ZJ932 TaxID=2810516 RepID=UPI00196843EB|nr:glycosyltransferase [Rothia sp. ZJ932]QRZ61179.1 glycosyl transferase [Rothia sp. ZJ932]
MSDQLADDGVRTYDLVVSVGTDYHHFDRLVGWVDAYLKKHPELTCLFQHGFTAPPRVAEGVERMPRAELLKFYAKAKVVVVQGGPGSILDAREVGAIPVAVPRVAELDEVVDNHQIEFSKMMDEYGEAHLVESAEALEKILDQALEDPKLVQGEVRLPQRDVASDNLTRALDEMVVIDRSQEPARFARRFAHVVVGFVAQKMKK